MTSSKKSKKQYDLDYKRRIVQEYLRGEIRSADLAAREGLDRAQIYKWKIQFDNHQRNDRIDAIADEEGVSLDQARKIRELEEELEASQKKIAQLVLENDLLKKIQPNSPFARKSSGYIETKQLLARSKGRAR
jgi:transposase-like protein